MKKLFLCILLSAFSVTLHSQLAVVKMLGKNANNSTIGFAIFDYWRIPLNETGNRNLMIELLDLAIFPRKDNNIDCLIGYLSMKVGYMYIFSQETKTGFYLEPSAGYCRTVRSEGEGVGYDGVAVAVEGGYTVEVGQHGNELNFGLKFERDVAGKIGSVSSLGFRFSYSFHLLKRRKNDY